MKSQTYQAIEKMLKENGFRLDRSSDSHFIWKNDVTGRSAPVPHHNKPLSVGIVLSIYRQAGIPKP